MNLADRMRIVCLSDTHGNTDLEVPPGDLLVHTGDHSRRGSVKELEQAARWLQALPHPHKVVIAGNHDFALQASEVWTRDLFSPMTYLLDEEVSINGLRIWGSPWTPTFGGVWAFQAPKLGEIWDSMPAGIDLLLTHGPPHGVLDRTFSGSAAGCKALAAKVAQVRPALHVFGHIHEAYGLEQQDETVYLNASNSAVGYTYPQPVHVLDWDGKMFTPVTDHTAADPLWNFLVERRGAPVALCSATTDQIQATEYLGQLFWLEENESSLRFHSRRGFEGQATPLTFGVKMSKSWLELLNTNRWTRLPTPARPPRGNANGDGS